jgi:release factor H-coupled RctB family protein
MGTLADSAALPANAQVITRADVWLEGEAVAQFRRVAGLPGCVRAVAMPDLHPGRGIPVGAAFAFSDSIYPALIGGDAGCGARVVATAFHRATLDTLLRRLEETFDEDLLAEADPAEVFEAVWREGPRGLSRVGGVPEPLARLASLEVDEVAVESGEADPYRVGFERMLGTVGGGNHFAEISRVGEVADAAAADALGLFPGTLVVLAHSGSRGLGGALARRWDAISSGAGGDPEWTYMRVDRGAGLVGEAAARYLGELAGACRFAKANRFLLAYRLLRALGAAREAKIVGGFDLTHNDVTRARLGGAEAWLHRKGASPAHEGAPTVVLGSRGAPSWVMLGAGNEALLSSVAHGAGRKMGRSEAREKIKARYRKADLRRTALGGRVVCSDPELLLEEHPDAYKPITPIIEVLRERGLAAPVASLLPLVTVKR